MEGFGKVYRLKPAHFVGLRLRFQPVGLPGRRVEPTPRRGTEPPRYKGTYTIV